jgi:H+/Cl- antiporter ClcA
MLFLIPLFLLIILLIFGVNFLWYWIKEELRRNGYKVYYFHSHLQDLSNFSDLIRKTSDPDIKAHYKKMRGYLNTLLIIAFVGFISGIVGLFLVSS